MRSFSHRSETKVAEDERAGYCEVEPEEPDEPEPELPKPVVPNPPEAGPVVVPLPDWPLRPPEVGLVPLPDWLESPVPTCRIFCSMMGS